MNKTLRKQLAIATSLQLVDGRTKRTGELETDMAPRASGHVETRPDVRPIERQKARREPQRHAGINE
jgi:hypothetical protein